MQINNHQIVDYDAVLDAKFGAEGTPERAEAEEKAYAFYTGQIIEDARKKAKITQAELARRIGSGRSSAPTFLISQEWKVVRQNLRFLLSIAS